jgi:hypothetical protein
MPFYRCRYLDSTSNVFQIQGVACEDDAEAIAMARRMSANTRPTGLSYGRTNAASIWKPCPRATACWDHSSIRSAIPSPIALEWTPRPCLRPSARVTAWGIAPPPAPPATSRHRESRHIGQRLHYGRMLLSAERQSGAGPEIRQAQLTEPQRSGPCPGKR